MRIGRVIIGAISALLALTMGVGFLAPAEAKPAAGLSRTGTLSDGSAYRIEVPANFNGTLLVYSHGLVFPGDPNPPAIAPDATTGQSLLARGYALAGSAFGTGYAVEQALRDQVELLDVYAKVAGKPKRKLAWGSSMGGLITGELVEKHPQRFQGGLATCGLMGGTVGLWNTYLDTMFVIKTLLGPSIRLTGDPEPFDTVGTVFGALEAAQKTPEGRARIALAVAIMDMPGWFGAGSPRPPAEDFDAQQEAQVAHLRELVVFLMVAARAEMEQHAGGNPSTNVGVDYNRQLRRSTDRAEVKGLYATAGVSLKADLHQLAAAPRIKASKPAVAYATKFATFSGDLHGRPMLTLHTTGDGAVAPEHEQAYAKQIRRAGDRRLLRQLFIERAGHCTFTPAELVASVQLIDQRVRTGYFPATDPASMKAKAIALGPELNGVTDDDSGQFIPVVPEFTRYHPSRFLRPVPGRS